MAETTIDIEKREIKATDEQVFNYLSDFNNYKELMPEAVSSWESDKDSCTLSVSMISNLKMQIIERKPNSYIKITGSGPFEFILHVNIEKVESTCKAGMTFEADINPFMKMMIEKPMGQFFGYLTKQVQAKFE